MKKNIIYFFLLICSVRAGFAQTKISKQEKQADQYFNSYSYVKARNCFRQITEGDSININATKKLAECYYILHDWPNSEKWLKKVVELDSVESKYLLLYAQALKSNGKMEESEIWMNKFQLAEQNDSRGQYHKTYGKDVKALKGKQSKFEIKPAFFNSVESDFSAVMFGSNTVVFASSRLNNPQIVSRSYAWNNKPFLDLYAIDISADQTEGKGKHFLHHINTKYHDGPVCFNKNYTVMYLTRNNVHTDSKEKGDGVNKLKIYKSVLKDGEWTEPVALPFNNDSYSVGHACLSPDEKKLYFVSDQPGSVGGTDIYFVDIVGDSTYGPVTSLGNVVNTEGNEMFPFVNKSGALFFSSDGHPGLGRLDIFYTNPKKDGSFGRVKNAGITVNSPQDDFGIYFKEDGASGYFASNRPGGKGDDDIYEFTLTGPLKNDYAVEGVVSDINTKNILKNAVVVLIDNKGQAVDSVTTSDDGKFSFNVESEQKYFLRAKANRYYSKEYSISDTSLIDEKVLFTQQIELEKDPGFTLVLTVFDPKVKANVEGTTVILTNKITGEKEMFTSDKDGKIKKELENKPGASVHYDVKVEKEGYLTNNITFEKILEKKGDQEVTATISKPQVGMDIGKIVEILPIYFDLGKSDIRGDAAAELDKIVAIMNEYPTMVIELGSHTDSRGSDGANLTLSDKRAKASANYIISKGISKDRIYGKGYGETRLINKCKNNVKCSETDHQVNRRTEFIIKKI